MVDKRHDVDRCDCNVIHEEIVNQVKAYPWKKTCMTLQNYSKSSVIQQELKYFGLWSKLRCVCDIAVLSNMTQSAISHQLRVLKGARLVKNPKDEKIVFYSLEDEQIKQIFDQGLIHINE